MSEPNLWEGLGAQDSQAGSRNVHGGGGGNIVFGVPPRKQATIGSAARLNSIKDYLKAREEQWESIQSHGYSKETFLGEVTPIVPQWEQPLTIWKERLAADLDARAKADEEKARLRMKIIERYLGNANPMDLTDLLDH